MSGPLAGFVRRAWRRGHVSCLSLLLAVWSCTAFPPAHELFDPLPSPEPVPLPPPPAKPVSRLSWPEALLLARERNPRIDEAKRRVARAESLLAEARAEAYPVVDGRVGYVRFIEAASFRGRTDSDAGSSETGHQGLAQAADDGPSPEFAAVMVEQYQRLLDQLADDDLRTLALAKMEGYSNQEIAAKIGCSVRTIERRLKLIRDAWKEEVP